MLGNGEEKRGGNLIGKRYTISSFKVSNDARQRIKFHQNLTFILPFCKRKEEHHFLRYAPPNSLISGRGFVWKEKKRVRKRQINKTANEWVLGKVCRKSYTIRHGRVSPPGCFSLLLRFPLKKKKNYRFYNFGNWPVKITYFPLSGRNLNLISKNSIPLSLFIGILCEKSDELTCSSFAKRRRKVRSVALNLRYLISSSFSKKITTISLAKIRRFSKISFRHFYNSLRLIYPREWTHNGS